MRRNPGKEIDLEIVLLASYEGLKLNFGYSPHVIQFLGLPLEDNVPPRTVYLESSYIGVNISTFL